MMTFKRSKHGELNGVYLVLCIYVIILILNCDGLTQSSVVNRNSSFVNKQTLLPTFGNVLGSADPLVRGLF